MKKIDINRSVFLKIGFIISISLSILAFNWTVYSESSIKKEVEIYKQGEDFKIIRTGYKKKRVMPPPPKLEVVEEISIAEDELIFTDQPVSEEENYVVNEVNVSDSLCEFNGSFNFKPIEPVQIVKPQVEDETVYNGLQVEKMPFMGNCYGLEKEEMRKCGELAFKSFLAKHMRYPVLARESGIEGTVRVQFIIGKTGEIEKAEIVRGVIGGCSEEVLRVIGLMPKWSPGIQGGKPVKVRYTAPVKFKLN